MRYVLGIRVCEDAVGCDRVVIDPHPVCGLTSASGWFDTPKGRIEVAWKVEDGRLNVKKILPEGVLDVNDIALRTKDATCRISAYGARVTSLVLGGSETLWMPDRDLHRPGKWRHGGIPLCWPWFGWREVYPGQECIHGFAHEREFTVRSLRETGDVSELVLGFSRKGQFDLEVSFRLTDRLEIICKTANVGKVPMPYVSAFHPYLLVGDFERIRVFDGEGKEPCDLRRDPLDDEVQLGAGDFSYCVDDPVRCRRIVLCSSKADRCNIWNCRASWPVGGYPQIDAFESGEWRRFISVEPVYSECRGGLLPGHDAVADLVVGVQCCTDMGSDDFARYL